MAQQCRHANDAQRYTKPPAAHVMSARVQVERCAI